MYGDEWHRDQGLNAPPPGPRWIDSRGRFLLAAVATGVITSVIAGGG
ncbi:RcnB family protein [Ameyamaea chiangmaiensis]|uniref:RcnB family protein n=1 Tax=Ameyamaea chiangmaiensis TaxID=442969 RepID=A0A850PC54_9PROT|nr:RcnB family protein [Ameyamaea chiangmaiensis]NVN40249.1 RcnB family protein [Ameyamaea chiangmaiensis]